MSTNWNIEVIYDKLSPEDKELFTRESLLNFLDKLNNTPREKLVMLCDHSDIQIRFTGNNQRKTIPEDEMILALLADYPKYKISQLLEELE